MPVGNIAPRTDVLTLTSMKLGNEEYPSTVQQAEGGNTGYLLYSPKSIWSGASYYETGATGPYVVAGAVLLTAGKYDIFGASTINGATEGTIKFDGTILVKGSVSATGTISSFTQSADGWVTVQSSVTLNGVNDGYLGWNIVARQYE